jgi:DNA (cytosine-5)-methyltransferase 1
MIRRDTHNPPTLFDGLIVDNFAGGGGASIGIERAIGRAVDRAVNHDPMAVAMHRANHPHTWHTEQDIWGVDPTEVTGGAPVSLAWFSPDCTHHSKARGCKPIRDPRNKSRDLAWVVLRWAAQVRPAVIMLENVEEFRDWGPLTRKRGRAKHPRPCKHRKGETFRRWKDQLTQLGYDVEHRELRACDFGAPTIRKRLYLVARRDGQPIQWPEVTHGRERGLSSDLKPYRTAAGCIDWSLPCPSIFERARPLAKKTLDRIAAGVVRHVINDPEPFVVRIGQHGGRGSYANGIDEALTTVTTKAEHCIVAPYIVPRYGEAAGQAPRSRPVTQPAATITPDGNGAQLCAAFLARHFGGMTGRDAREPLPTTTGRGTQNQAVAVHLNHQYSSNTNGGQGDLRRPLPTVTAGGNHASMVAALLAPYYGSGSGTNGWDLRDPAPTVSTKDRLQLVTVHLDGEPYVITDIGMRMLQPHELYAAQGFPDDYVIDHGVDSTGQRVRLNKTTQVRLCGNSVCPPVAEALVRANLSNSGPHDSKSYAPSAEVPA